MNSHRNKDPILIINQLVLRQVVEYSETKRVVNLKLTTAKSHYDFMILC